MDDKEFQVYGQCGYDGGDRYKNKISENLGLDLQFDEISEILGVDVQVASHEESSLDDVQVDSHEESNLDESSDKSDDDDASLTEETKLLRHSLNGVTPLIAKLPFEVECYGCLSTEEIMK